MGKDNITFHSQIWPAELLAYDGAGERGGAPGHARRAEPADRGGVQRVPDDERLEVLHLPQDRHLRRRLPARVRPRRAAVLHRRRRPGEPGRRLHLGGVRAAHQLRAGQRVGQPGQPVDLHGAQELRRDPGSRRRATDAGRRTARGRPRQAFTTVGDLLARSRFKAASGEAMRVVGLANKYISESEPWKLGGDPERQATVLHTALQVVDDAKTLLTPFLPHSSQQVFEALGGRGRLGGPAGDPRGHRLRRRRRGRRRAGRRRLPGDHRRLRRRAGGLGTPGRSRSGRPLAKPTPLFTKLDPKLGETGPPGRRSREPAVIEPPDRDQHAMRATERRDGPHPAVAERPLVPPPEPLPAPVVDAHTHLDACGCRDADDVAAAMARAAAVGVAAGRHRRRRPGLRPLGGARGRAGTRTCTRRSPCTPPGPTRSTTTPARRARAAGRRPAGGRGRRDRARPLLGRRAARRPGRGLRLAHRPGQAAGQAADDPRPGRPRRRAGHPARARARRRR